MNQLYPILLFILVVIALFVNMIGLMRLIPLFITLPLLFISIYFMLYSILNRKKVYRRMR
ncbi:hypothetical protein [Oceanobacillus alkalisoli]|uniref:hypothetical protein n=1 Tax=Oceanobacillus alkalisoli TaxID=2925113 RepID=UPI001EE400DF|nr:hypothetical protein [Oceanobacillus alkalisoli]MCG5105058.1 hypothetical protein [Oceanobacillus alkalisoli]